MLKTFLKWGASSLRGHLVVSGLTVSVPMLVLGLAVNFEAGYPTADLGVIIFISALAGIPPALVVWYYITVPLRRRKQGAR